ncbi:SMP-30/gluconolactonase/LRE family protein [Bermanella sp. R86510]|uniref:SMP-30/gluconolactonase/LRE family protein n=1 Tax=unclassified Bermanella TaxID=2627862 RepID=UPI0037C51B7B
MKKYIILAAIVALLAYLLLWPVKIDPVAWQSPENRGYTGPFAQNQALSQIDVIPLANEVGPEDVAIDLQGRPVMGVLSGNILRLNDSNEFETVANTQGRPLGIEYDAQGVLWIADAYNGLMSMQPNGDLTTVLTHAEGTAISYADDLDVASSGKVYLSDASTKFHAKSYGTFAASLLDINEHGGHGRLIEYDPKTQQASVILDGVNFANGVAVSHDENWVLLNETGTYRILKVGIADENRGHVQVVIDNLPSFPDNINPGDKGLYWVGLVSPRSAPLDALSEYPFLRKVVQRLPAFMRPNAKHFGHLIAINDQGEVVHDLQDPLGMYGHVTGAVEAGGYLYVSSLHEPALGRAVNVNKR